MDNNLVITVFLQRLGSTEGEQARAAASFLRVLADELEEHGRFGTGANPCYVGNVMSPVAEYHLE